MQTLDWGQVTPESANLQTNTFVYVYNHDITSIEKIDRTIRFIIGRLIYYDSHLPKDPIHQIKIDIRGQQIENSTCEYIYKELKLKYSRPDALEIEFVK
jgi:hypothetical protein